MMLADSQSGAGVVPVTGDVVSIKRSKHGVEGAVEPRQRASG